MMKIKELLRIAFQFKATEADVFRVATSHILATCLAIGYLSYVLFFLTLAVASDVERPEPFVPPLESAIDVPTLDFLQIGDWHLFGQALTNDSAETAVTETQLQLTLLGVFLLSHAPEAAGAIIQAEGGQQKKYRSGDELPGGASIQAIEKKRVVLFHNNRQEFLPLKRNSVGLPATTE